MTSATGVFRSPPSCTHSTRRASSAALTHRSASVRTLTRFKKCLCKNCVHSVSIHEVVVILLLSITNGGLNKGICLRSRQDNLFQRNASPCILGIKSRPPLFLQASMFFCNYFQRIHNNVNTAANPPVSSKYIQLVSRDRSFSPVFMFIHRSIGYTLRVTKAPCANLR